MRQRRRRKASRNIGFSATLSARALKVAGSSFRLFFHQAGTRPQRSGTSLAPAVALDDGVDRLRRAEGVVRPQVRGRPGGGEPVESVDLGPGQAMGGASAHERCSFLLGLHPDLLVEPGLPLKVRQLVPRLPVFGVRPLRIDWHRAREVVSVPGQQEGDAVDIDEQAVEGAAQRRLAPKFVLRRDDRIPGAAQLGQELVPCERRQDGLLT